MANPSPTVEVKEPGPSAAPTAHLSPDQQKMLKRMEALVASKMRMMVGDMALQVATLGAQGEAMGESMTDLQNKYDTLLNINGTLEAHIEGLEETVRKLREQYEPDPLVG